jgi:hypothetical protein
VRELIKKEGERIRLKVGDIERNRPKERLRERE